MIANNNNNHFKNNNFSLENEPGCTVRKLDKNVPLNGCHSLLSNSQEMMRK